MNLQVAGRKSARATRPAPWRPGLSGPVRVPNDAPIESRWLRNADHRRPRCPHRRIAPAMRPLTPRAGLGAARSRTSDGGHQTWRPVLPGETFNS